MSEVIGELVEQPGEVRYEWRIPDFLSLPEEADKFYLSPKFFFSDMCWGLKIYPSGEIKKQSEGWIGLYVHRMDYGSPKTVSFSIGIKESNGLERIYLKEESRKFLKEKGGWGRPRFLQRSNLSSRDLELLPLGSLTLICTMRSSRQHSMNTSLFGRLWNVSLSSKKILTARKRTDVVLKLRDGEMSAHKLILEARSPVFNRMFDVDMRETQTGEVSVEDADETAFRIVLNYAYSGDPEGLSTKNVCEVFKIAHKYDLEELTKLCTELMQECLSVDTVCDVIAVAEVYQEKELKGRAKDYFVNNAAEIVETEKWKALKSENLAIVSELLECIIVENALKIKN